MKPDKNPKVESRLDSLFWIQNDKEEFILNIEPQGYYESSLPARMLRYRSDIWEIKKDYIINNKLIGDASFDESRTRRNR